VLPFQSFHHRHPYASKDQLLIFQNPIKDSSFLSNPPYRSILRYPSLHPPSLLAPLCFSSYFFCAAHRAGASLLLPFVSLVSLFRIFTSAGVFIATPEMIAWPLARDGSSEISSCLRIQYSGYLLLVGGIDYPHRYLGHAL